MSRIDPVLPVEDTISMNYENLDADLLAVFPELKAAYLKMLTEWEKEKPGQYIIFEDIFARYIEHFLVASPSPVRDSKLRDMFKFIEDLFASGGEVENLAFVAMLEGRPDTWLQAAKPFLGPRAEAALDEFNPWWREEAVKNAKRHKIEFHDFYGLQELAESTLSSGRR